MLSQKQLDEICEAGKLIICYDLDDTLIDFRTQAPYPKRVAEVKQRYAEGHYIIIQTAREKITQETTELQLAEWGIPFHEFLYGNKPKAHLYIDDSAVNADDYFVNPEKYLRIFRAIGDSINWFIRKRNGMQ